MKIEFYLKKNEGKKKRAGQSRTVDLCHTSPATPSSTTCQHATATHPVLNGNYFYFTI